jgi:septal ring factor EnvC (AmiA/AmiB activator)
MRLRRWLLPLLLAALLGPAPLPVYGQVDRSEQARLEAEIRAGRSALERQRAEIDAITRELGTTEATLAGRIAERDRVSRDLRDLEVRRADLQAGIATLEGAIATSEVRIAALLLDLESIKGRVQGLLRNLHRQRNAGYGTSLAGAETFHEVAVRSHFVNLMAAQDVAVVQELDGVIAAVEGERARLARQVTELEGSVVALTANAQALAQTRSRLDGLITELRATEAGQRAQQRALLEAQTALGTQLDNLDRALAQEIARLQAEERRLRQQAESFVTDRARQAALQAQADATRARIDNLTAPIPAPTAGYVSPLDQGVVVTRFGEGNNSFVSLRADRAGAAVRSVQAGVVASVAPIGANDGYLVSVRHSATTTTVYTNLRPPVVALGDAVSAGTVLGYLGGGTLIPADVLRFYVRRTDGGGNTIFVDPGPLLGI